MYNNEYNKQFIMNEVTVLQQQLNEELSKSDNERDYKKEFDLLYKQFIKGLKLSTGNNFF